jgi:hypothetical protein
MLLNVYILLQILAITALIITFFTKTPLSSAVSMVISAILMVGAWVLQIGGQYVWDPSIRAYVRETIYVQTGYLAGFNILLFSLSLLFFMHDMYELITKASGLGDTNINQGGEF